MSFQTFVTERLAAITSALNAISTNAKKIDELPIQNTLDLASKIHVSDNGVSKSLELQKILDAFNSENYDKLISVGVISLVDNIITIPAGAMALINDFTLTTPIVTEITIPYTSSGLIRTDLLVFTEDSEIILITGTEGTIAFTPPKPLNTVVVTTIDVADNSIGGMIPPVIGSNFKTKLENAQSIVAFFDSTEFVQAKENSQYVISNSDTGIMKAILVTGTELFMYEGKEVSFENQTGAVLTFKHLDATIPVATYKKFNFPTDVDFKLPNKYKLVFRYYAGKFDFWQVNNISTQDNKFIPITISLADLGLTSFDEITKDIAANYVKTIVPSISEIELYQFEVVEFIEPTIEYNFDVDSSDWSLSGITDKASFESVLGVTTTEFSISGGNIKAFIDNVVDNTLDISSKNITNVNFITIDNLTYLYLINNQIVNFNTSIALPNNLEDLDLSHNQIVNFNPTVALPSGLININLRYNQIVNFNPTVALPSSLTYLSVTHNKIVNFNPTVALPSALTHLDLRNNKMTTSGYTASEVWANAQPSFINTCNIYFSDNINSITGTTLKTLLLTKNVNIIA